MTMSQSIPCYTPAFVTTLVENGQAEQVQTLSWADQVRRSAPLNAMTASALLLDPQAFNISQQEQAATVEQPLDGWQQQLSQACINLFTFAGLTLRERLYALGLLLNQAQQLAGQADAAVLLDHWLDNLQQLIEQGQLSQELARVPAIPTLRLAALRRLGDTQLDLTSLDTMVGLSLSLKLNELSFLSDEYLADELMLLDRSQNIMAEHGYIIANFLLYRCYHDIFPGDDSDNYLARYYLLCNDLFALTMLGAFLIEELGDMDQQQWAVLFSSWAIHTNQHPLDDAGQDPLLQGLALI